MEYIEYKSRNLKGACLYAPETDKPLPLPLVVWLTGGNYGAQLPLKVSLGKLLDKGELNPECAVLMPEASYGHNYTTMTREELAHIIEEAARLYQLDVSTVSICGWSLGADAVAMLTAGGTHLLFGRVCLISNYPKAWNGAEPVKDYRILVGAKEKSAARDWGVYPVERVPGYGHEIGEKIWLDERIDLLGWLTKECLE